MMRLPQDRLEPIGKLTSRRAGSRDVPGNQSLVTSAARSGWDFSNPFFAPGGWEFRPLAVGLALLLTALFLTGCGHRESRSSPEPERLRIGVLADVPREAIEQRYAGLIRFLSQTLKMPCELVIPARHEELVDDMAAGRVDLAFLGGYTYVLARQRSPIVPLVMRDVDRHATSVFLKSQRHVGVKLDDFKGARFAFGANLSTSGHLMPRRLLQERGILAEKFFRDVRFSGGHQRTAHLVRDGEVELGVANSLMIRKMFQAGDLKEGDVTVIEESPPFTDCVWAARAELSAELRARIRAAFLSLTMLNPIHAVILTDQSATGYLPALEQEFVDIERAVRELQSDVSEGLKSSDR